MFSLFSLQARVSRHSAGLPCLPHWRSAYPSPTPPLLFRYPLQQAAMLRMYAAAMAAALVGPAFAVPVAPGISFEHSLVLGSALPQDAYSAVEGELTALMTQTNGLQTTAVVMAGSDSRRLQAGSSSTLTITYVVACGSSCDAVAAVSANPLAE